MGERTELEDVAMVWRKAYHRWVEDEHRRDMLGTRRPQELTEAVRVYLAHREGIVSAATLSNDRQALRHLQMDWRGSVHRIDPQKTIDRLLGSLSPNTVATHSAFLSSFFRWLDLPYRVSLPKVQPPEARTWSDSEIEKLRRAAKKKGALLTIDCGLFMGLRQGEIWGLEWSDVDTERGVVRVRRQSGGRPLKGRRARTAVILPGWTHNPSDGSVVESLKTGAQHRLMRAVLRAAKLDEPGVRWHSLRHTYARLFLEAKPDMRLLQSSLGHASVTTTERTYNHLLPDRAAEMFHDHVRR
jgi:integrase